MAAGSRRTLGSLALEHYGPGGRFLLLAIVQGCTVATALFRLWRGPARAETRDTAVAIAHGVTPGAARLNPDAPPQDPGAPPQGPGAPPQD